MDTSERLRQMRQLLISNNYDAYLVGPNDEHGSEYVTEFDRRLRFISGFSGSNGYALVLLDRAVLFTDGRYELQADADLDCNWWLVVGQEQLADIVGWLKAQNASNLRIGMDARLMSLAAFDYLNEQLRTKLESEFALISQDLVDIVWDSHLAGAPLDSAAASPPPRRRPDGPLQVHPREFAGHLGWEEKMAKLAELMQQHRARHYVVSKLDDIAWLLNLRGSDIPMSPLFKAYLFITRQPLGEVQAPSPAGTGAGKPVTSVEQLLNAMEIQHTNRQPALQQRQAGRQQPQPAASQLIKVTFYVDLNKITGSVREHLHMAALNGSTLLGSADSQPTIGSAKIQIELKDYDVFVLDFGEKFSIKSLQGNQEPTSGGLQGRLLLDAQANVAIHVLAKNYEDRLVLVEPLIQRLKAVKSNVEVQGMRQAHWRDSLAISMLLSQLERDLSWEKGRSGRGWTEVSAAKELEFYRSLMDHNRGQSFDSISAYGSNGAIVHYRPNMEEEREEDHRPLANESTYLLDSGGQYLDGTTDITRTVHWGQPSDWQRETYTRVLMGAIDMMSLVFPGGEQLGPGRRLNDLLARRHLMELGLDYAHGTGHGIGAYSLVHEAPPLIEHFATGAGAPKSPPRGNSPAGAAQFLNDPLPLQANMFSSVEPGYYEAGEFGIRLENIVVTQEFQAPLANATSGGGPQRTWLRFEPISLVPFEPKLIKFELMSNKQKAWLNSYNLMVRLRMTQQINSYLIRARHHQKLKAHSARLQAPSGPAAASNATSGQALEAIQEGQRFLRMEPSKFQELLEQTHKWIMKKTELIPLDVPQRLVARLAQAPLAPAADSPPSAAADSDGAEARPKGDLWSSLGSDPDGQRLMLAYMAQPPFCDQEAGQAAAALLGGRSEADATSGGLAHASEKCTGIECDLLLLEALNAHQAGVHGGAQQQQQRAPGASGWKSSAANQEQTAQSNWDKWRQQLMDLFQLDGTQSGDGNWSASVLANMWPLLCLGALLVLVLQFALMLYVCNGSSAAPPPSGQEARGGQRARKQATIGRWQTTASGRRLAQLGDSLASFRLGRDAGQSNVAAAADQTTVVV